MILALVILSILVALLGYTTYINYKRYTKAVEYAENSFYVYNTFIANLYLKFRDTLSTMKAVDARGSFQVDDEVGVTFDNIKACITDLDEFISRYVESKEEVN